MDLRQLQAFLAVIDHGGFTAAAKATHTVQSNISTHVARLERELDATLIDRSTGRPTQEGEAVLVRVRRIQNELASLESDVSSLRGSPRGVVRVGMIGTTARWLAPILADELGRAAPEIQLVIADGTNRSLELRLLDGELDLGVVSLPVDDPEIVTYPLFNEDHIVVGPTDHPLAKSVGQLDLAELARYPLLLAAPGTGFRQEVEDTFRNAGLRPKVKMEVDGLRLLASMAFQGYGISIVPATAAPGWIGGPWTRIPVNGLSQRTVGIAIRRRGMPTVAAQTTERLIRQLTNERASEVPGLQLLDS
ncbi:MAG: LysR family transcriptional regulator [Actinomycetia bacterium]|nr:LysR family transcriptional regulator [Actinomycetes bacterium]MCP5030410.1 LysR family transcriptional regulator [Actinomycetes bacterium]